MQNPQKPISKPPSVLNKRGKTGVFTINLSKDKKTFRLNFQINKPLRKSLKKGDGKACKRGKEWYFCTRITADVLYKNDTNWITDLTGNHLQKKNEKRLGSNEKFTTFAPATTANVLTY